jgi:hypothetical protein
MLERVNMPPGNCLLQTNYVHFSQRERQKTCKNDWQTMCAQKISWFCFKILNLNVMRKWGKFVWDYKLARIVVQDQLRHKSPITKPHLNQWLCVVTHACHRALWGSTNCNTGQPWHKARPYLKITKTEWTGAQLEW